MTLDLTTLDSDAQTALGVSTAILAGDWATLDSLLAPAFTYDGDLGTPYSRDEYIGFMQAMKGAMSDMTMDFTHVVSQGGVVSVRFVTHARQTGKFMGAPATGKSVEGRDIQLLRKGSGAEGQRKVWIIAQQHPGEHMAEWFMEGVIERLERHED